MEEQNLADELSPGQQLLCYRIDNVIGRGAFGITYLAEDINLHRAVAIKEFFPKQYCARASDATTAQPFSDESTSQFKSALDRFLSEARTLAQLEHPNIIRVNNVFAKNGTAYMVMNYEDGVSLASLLKQEGTISEARLSRLVTPLLSGLEKIHSTGFIHRDIKPANIYIHNDGMPVLIGFGSARQSIQEHDESLTSMVSLGYAPIEQYTRHGGQEGPWTDIYGLAATLYRATTGNLPPAAVDRAETVSQGYNDDVHTLIDTVHHRYSAQFLGAIKHGLALRSHERPPTIEAWRLEFGLEAPTDYELDDTDYPDWEADTAASATFTAFDHKETDGDYDHHVITEYHEDERTSQLRAIPETDRVDQDDDESYITKSAAPARKASAQKASAAVPAADDAITDYTRTEILAPEEHSNVISSIQNHGEPILFRNPGAADDIEKEASDLPRMTPLASEDPVTEEMPTGHETGQPRVKSRHKLRYFALTGTLCLVLAGVLASMSYTDTVNRLIADLQNAVTASTAELSSDALFPDTDTAPADPRQAEPANREQPTERPETVAHTNEPLEFEAIPTPQVAEQTAGQAQDDKQEEIERLLNAAQNDVRDRRLTTPEGNNAYEKYQAVLAKDADNQKAREGLNNILNLYLRIARQSLDRGNIQHAEEMLTRASKVDSDSPRLLQTRNAIRQQRTRQENTGAAPQQSQQRAPLSPPLHN
ncbi:hypothetical protein J2T55_002485 [Methylohalomonas lacus]|uniref:non-specific serine/threonine protein kinase n=1 Tax=Methylohalomonas lacus TaxID=398773 RepID=A0AAE3L1R2_9GAMM|nr:protein kinase [Methylohalomonas lacus]MCS3904449.1 hypothetical protein [Methylohalomonas lacus]